MYLNIKKCKSEPWTLTNLTFLPNMKILTPGISNLKSETVVQAKKTFSVNMFISS